MPAITPPNATDIPVVATTAVGAKLGACFILLGLTAILVFLPLIASRGCKRSLFSRSLRDMPFMRVFREHGLAGLNCLAGGVFLATSFLHILVDAQEELTEGLTDAKVDTEFPVANALVLAGIVLVLTIEQLATYVEGRGSINDDEDRSLLANRDGLSFRSSLRSRSFTQLEQAENFKSSLRAVLLALAISVHSIFEGMAIGLQSSENGVFSLLLVVSIHKFVVTLSLGLNLVQVRPGKQFFPVLCTIIYCFAAPIGLIIGLLVADLASGLVVGVLQSLACGTFIYVAVFEILPEELQNPKRVRTLCVIMFLLGLVIVALINLFTPHDHHHDHHDHHDHH